jgi:hypothetical protein
MRRIAICLFGLCLLLPLGCKDDTTAAPADDAAAPAGDAAADDAADDAAE